MDFTETMLPTPPSTPPARPADYAGKPVDFGQPLARVSRDAPA